MNTYRRIVNGKLVEFSIGGAQQSISGGLGDKIATVSTPIARAIGSDCIDKTTNQLKPDSGCGKMKARLNAGMSIAEAIKLRIQGK